MKLMLVTTSYPSQGEGEAAAGVFVADFARALADDGHDVVVVAPALQSTREAEQGVTVWRFAVPRLPLSVLGPFNPAHWRPIMTTLHAGQVAVRQACEHHRPDHILALWALPCGYWAGQVSRETGIGYSTWALGSDIWSLGRVPVVRGLLARTLRQASLRYADGLQLGKAVSDLSGMDCGFLPSSRMLPCTPREFRRAPPWRLAFLGRWHANKGADLLINALQELNDDDWSRISEFRFAGGGPLESEIRARASALISAGRPFSLSGFLDRQAAAELLGWADFLVLPSRIESIPVIFSDALQAQCPVIATPVGDLPDLVGAAKPCGVLADEVSSHALVTALRDALQCEPEDFSAGMSEMKQRFDIRAASRAFVEDIGGVS